MKTCESKRGFFILYDCKKESTDICPECKRHLCPEHFQISEKICYECQAKSVSNEKDTYSQLESYRIRQKRLSDDERTVFYFGTDLGSYYDSYDIRSFDMELANIADMDDSPDEIFFDS